MVGDVWMDGCIRLKLVILFYKKKIKASLFCAYLNASWLVIFYGTYFLVHHHHHQQLTRGFSNTIFYVCMYVH